MIDVSLYFEFPTTNNLDEYAAFFAGLMLADEIGAKYTPSQVERQTQTKDSEKD